MTGYAGGAIGVNIAAKGSASFAGKITAASTEDSDGGDVVVTKDYLGSAGSGGTGALGYWTRTGTNLSPVNASDNVGIGLNNPAYALDVASSDSATGYAVRLRANDTAGLCGIQFTSSTNPVTLYANIFGNSDQSLSFGTGGGGREKMRIDANGNVGIGTDNPKSPLHVFGANSINVIADFSAPPSDPVGAVPATILIQGRNDVGALSQQVMLQAYQKEGTSSTEAALDIKVRAGGETYNDPLTKMTILGSGNVGIGTTNPQSQLQIFAPGDGATDVYSTLQLSGHVWSGVIRGGVKANVGAEMHLGIRTNDTVEDVVTIDSFKNVGIGTTDPSGKLTISTPDNTSTWALRVQTDGLANESGFFRESDGFIFDLRNDAGEVTVGMRAESGVITAGGYSFANLQEL